MRVGSAHVITDPANATGAVHAVAHEVAAGVFDCAVIDAEGTVLVRLDGYRTIPLPTSISDEVAADLHTTFRS